MSSLVGIFLPGRPWSMSAASRACLHVQLLAYFLIHGIDEGGARSRVLDGGLNADPVGGAEVPAAGQDPGGEEPRVLRLGLATLGQHRPVFVVRV